MTSPGDERYLPLKFLTDADGSQVPIIYQDIPLSASNAERLPCSGTLGHFSRCQ
jgi:hypothetical protein